MAKFLPGQSEVCTKGLQYLEQSDTTTLYGLLIVVTSMVFLSETCSVQGAAIFEVEVEHAWSGVTGD